VALLAVGVFVYPRAKTFLTPVAPIPDPDLTAMEPQVAEKIAETRRLVGEEPRSADKWGQLGRVFHAHELFPESAACYAEAARLDPSDYRWPYLAAQALEEIQEIDGAVARIEEAIALEPGSAPLHVLAAQLHEHRGDEASALESYRRAVEIDAHTAVAAFGIGRLLLSAGKLEEGIEWLERAKNLQPSAGAIRASLARAYRRSGDRERAQVEAQAASQLHPQVSLDDPVMAAVTEEGVSLVGLQERAIAAEERGEPRRAEALRRRMIELQPDDANLYYNLANNLSRQSRHEEAIPMFEKALELDPEHTSTLVNLGILFSQLENYERATELFERALRVEPEHPGALASLGKAVFLQRDVARAIDLLERSRDRDPTRPDTHYSLAQMLRVVGRLPDAIASLEQAVALAPESGEMHFELALAYAESGDFSSAWREVELAEGNGFAPPPRFLAALEERAPRP
jgi:tetratricopeptide (TPR) repeat protein